MSNRVRAKFKVTQVTTYEEETGTINLAAVYDDDPESENGQFFRYTPSGQIDLSIVQPDALKFFKPGCEYYVDFVLVPE